MSTLQANRLKDPYKIHFNSDESDSDSGKSDFDEDFYKYQPPPLVIPESAIIKISKDFENNLDVNRNTTESQTSGCQVLNESKRSNQGVLLLPSTLDNENSLENQSDSLIIEKMSQEIDKFKNSITGKAIENKPKANFPRQNILRRSRNLGRYTSQPTYKQNTPNSYINDGFLLREEESESTHFYGKSSLTNTSSAKSNFNSELSNFITDISSSKESTKKLGIYVLPSNRYQNIDSRRNRNRYEEIDSLDTPQRRSSVNLPSGNQDKEDEFVLPVSEFVHISNQPNNHIIRTVSYDFAPNLENINQGNICEKASNATTGYRSYQHCASINSRPPISPENNTESILRPEENNETCCNSFINFSCRCF